MSTGLTAHSEPDPMKDGDSPLDQLDWEDVYEAIADARLFYGKSKLWPRIKGRLAGRPRGLFEVMLITPGGHNWVLASHSRRQEVESMEDFIDLSEDPVEWLRSQDRANGRTGLRTPLVHVLREAQLRKTGLLPGDAVELTEAVHTTTRGQDASIPAGALAEVDDIWLGVGAIQGVVVSPPARPDLRVPLEPRQLSLLHAAPSPVRGAPKRWQYAPQLDAWLVAGRGRQ